MLTEEFNVDEAIANIESTGSAQGAPEQPAAPTPQEIDEWEYETALGKKVKEPREMVLKRAGQGYNYAQLMHNWKLEQEQKAKEWEGKEKSWQELQRYKEYEDYANQNPAWRDHVQKMWEQKDQLQAQGGDNPNNAHFAELQSLKKELAEIKEFTGSLKEEREKAQRETEDKTLAEEIDSIRKRYGQDVDFDLADESGKSLEMQVLEHASKMGIKSFKTAFLDFYHDKLIKTREVRAAEQVVKAKQQQVKAGVVGRSPAPQKDPDEWMDQFGVDYR